LGGEWLNNNNSLKNNNNDTTTANTANTNILDDSLAEANTE
jgi:hypothetical protein